MTTSKDKVNPNPAVPAAEYDTSERSDVSRDHEVLPGSIEDPTPVERAIATGTKPEVLDPKVPTGQNSEQIAAELVEPDSNLELQKAAGKRASAEDYHRDDEPKGRSARSSEKA